MWFVALLLWKVSVTVWCDTEVFFVLDLDKAPYLLMVVLATVDTKLQFLLTQVTLAGTRFGSIQKMPGNKITGASCIITSAPTTSSVPELLLCSSSLFVVAVATARDVPCWNCGNATWESLVEEEVGHSLFGLCIRLLFCVEKFKSLLSCFKATFVRYFCLLLLRKTV